MIFRFFNQENIDFNSEIIPLWDCLISIIQTNIIYESSIQASELIILLISKNVEYFTNHKYYKIIIDVYQNHLFEVKCLLVAASAAAFVNATVSQLQILFNENNFCKLLIDYLPNISFSFKFFPLIISGIIKIITYSDTSKEGMNIFNNLIATNNDFISWYESIPNELSSVKNETVISSLITLKEIIKTKFTL